MIDADHHVECNKIIFSKEEIQNAAYYGCNKFYLPNWCKKGEKCGIIKKITSVQPYSGPGSESKNIQLYYSFLPSRKKTGKHN